ncbi:reverse transcriptase domain-containing protein [Tanacetum coccineum]|uniref:Reverse transcriptase domain-containing protein n=1 Tax=Tanacetum coccineum TaxID=301880 RepID=A0ABQ5I3G9_9ASTR
MMQNEVSDDALRLSFFPYSLTHHATAWYDPLPRNSIHSFDDMMRKFLSKYFPPSMVTKLGNEIMNFRQDPNESLFEAWEHYKLSIDQCPNHNMLLVTQIDMFYNGLTLRHRDTINAVAGGTFMQKTPKESVMSSASSAVTYTSVYTDSEPDRAFWGANDEEPVALPSPDYIPGLEDPQTPPVPQDEDEREPMFAQAHDPDYVPEPVYPEYIPLEDEHVFPAEEQSLPPVDLPTAELPGYITEPDPEEDPEEYEDD